MCLQALTLIAEESIIYLLKQSSCSWHRVPPDEMLIFARLKFGKGSISMKINFSKAAKQQEMHLHSNVLYSFD